MGPWGGAQGGHSRGAWWGGRRRGTPEESQGQPLPRCPCSGHHGPADVTGTHPSLPPTCPVLVSPPVGDVRPPPSLARPPRPAPLPGIFSEAPAAQPWTCGPFDMAGGKAAVSVGGTQACRSQRPDLYPRQGQLIPRGRNAVTPVTRPARGPLWKCHCPGREGTVRRARAGLGAPGQWPDSRPWRSRWTGRRVGEAPRPGPAPSGLGGGGPGLPAPGCGPAGARAVQLPSQTDGQIAPLFPCEDAAHSGHHRYSGHSGQ